MKLAKVCVTSFFMDWWESDLRDIFVNPDDIKIISAVIEEGKLYLIYTYNDN